MAYITGTVSDANPGPALYALMAPALTTAGYTLVDTVVISTRTHKIWKNPAANNPANRDYYIDIAYTTTGAGTFGLYPYEFFDPATDLAYRGCYFYYYNPDYIETTYYSHWGDTGLSLENYQLGCYPGNTGSNTSNRDQSVTTTGFGYWISATPTRIAMVTTNSPAVLSYTGLFTPDAAWTANVGSLAFPLVSLWTAFPMTSGYGYGLATRVPKLTGNTYWSQVVSIGSNPLPWATLPGGTSPITGTTRKASPVMIYYSGGRVGTASGLAVMLVDTVVRGDTITVDGVPHIFTTPNGSYSFLIAAV